MTIHYASVRCKMQHSKDVTIILAERWSISVPYPDISVPIARRTYRNGNRLQHTEASSSIMMARFPSISNSS